MEIRRARARSEHENDEAFIADLSRMREELMAATRWDAQQLHEAGPEGAEQRLAQFGHSIVETAELEEAS